jgi:hypothetical protein
MSGTEFSDIGLWLKDLPKSAWLFGYLPGEAWIDALTILIWISITLVPLTMIGQSTGKICIGIRVEVKDGHAPSVWRGLLREWTKLPLFPWFMLTMNSNREQKGVHDFVAGTMVFKLPQDEKRTGFLKLWQQKSIRYAYYTIIGLIIGLVTIAITGLGSRKTSALQSAAKAASIVRLDSIIAEYPDFGDAYYARANFYLSSSPDIDRALRDMRMAVKLCPNRIEFKKGLANAIDAKARLLDLFIGKKRAANKGSGNISTEQSNNIEEPPPFSLEGKTPEALQGELSREVTLIGKQVTHQQMLIARMQYLPFLLQMTVDPAKPVRKSMGYNCFVVTAVSGDEGSFEVTVLRQFRDDIMVHNFVGRYFLKYYMEKGPGVAGWLSVHKRLLWPCRLVVRPVAWMVWFWIHAWIVLAVILIAALTRYLVLQNGGDHSPANRISTGYK